MKMKTGITFLWFWKRDSSSISKAGYFCFLTILYRTFPDYSYLSHFSKFNHHTNP